MSGESGGVEGGGNVVGVCPMREESVFNPNKQTKLYCSALRAGIAHCDYGSDEEQNMDQVLKAGDLRRYENVCSHY